MIRLAPTAEPVSDTTIVFGLAKTSELLNATVMEIAATDIPVLIRGESGTGKDIYARLLHRLSNSPEAEFRKMSCSIRDSGEFLQRIHAGWTPNSNTHLLGTLFLDGIDELDPACQRALLSALPDGQSISESMPRGIRIVSSTCQNIEESVESGNFRKELYFRLNGICLRLPPLRERKEDIAAFLDHFLKKHSQELKRPVPSLDQEALDTLLAHDWPGNIRQLENLVRKMVALGNAKIAMNDLQAQTWDLSLSLRSGSSLKLAAKAASKKAERELIMQALQHTRWNRKRAARELQISYKSLLYKIKQIGVLNGKNET
jgi:two-component system, NtrC family, response regulator AtoC